VQHATCDKIDYAKELKAIDEELVKVRAKLAKRGPEPKYLELQTKLEERRAKYIRRQQRQVAGAVASKPGSTPSFPEPMSSHTELTNETKTIPKIFEKRQTPKNDLLAEVDLELRKAKEMLTTIENNQPTSTPVAPPPKKVIKEQGTTMFAVPSELASMKEKKEHLIAEQKKIGDKIAHRQRQIDKIKNWQREVEKMNELQKEKQKIFELQQDLKRLEKQQYEQDQKLKTQMYHVKKMAHSKSNELKRLDAIETFNARKQHLRQSPVAPPVSGEEKVVPAKPGLGDMLRKAINSLFAGERVMFQKGKTPSIAPANVTIETDKKSGMPYYSPEPSPTHNETKNSLSAPPENKIETTEVIELAKNTVCEPTPDHISKHQLGVYRDYFCDKLNVSKKGITKCFDLVISGCGADKDLYESTLINAYKEICDDIKFN
jgi:myosin heavy subunit